MVRLTHPLLGAAVRAQIERAASEHRGRRWVSQGFTSLDDRASHPCGILRGAPFSVFAKLGAGPDAREQFTAELAGLRLISPAVPVPVPVAGGLADTEASGLTDVLAAYQEILPVDPGFAGRRELWRLPAYLAVVAVAGDDPIGRRYLDRLAAAIRLYR
jgi:fructosamine-3-kinase